MIVFLIVIILQTFNFNNVQYVCLY